MNKVLAKKYFKLSVTVCVLAVVIFALALATGTKKTLPLNQGLGSTNYVGTFANSQVDTLTFQREAGLSGLAFAVHWKDSVNVTRAVVYRQVDGQWQWPAANDTIITAFTYNDSTSAPWGPGYAVTKTITLAPLADNYVVVITYAGTLNGVTTPTVRYEFIKQLSAK
jgi:hypothetical protein